MVFRFKIFVSENENVIKFFRLLEIVMCCLDVFVFLNFFKLW